VSPVLITRSSQVDSIVAALRDGESDIDDGGTYSQHLIDAYVSKKVDITLIRRALANTFRIRFRLGLFDNGGGGSKGYLEIGAEAVNDAAAQSLNKEASRQSMILLQNRQGGDRQGEGRQGKDGEARTLPFAVPPPGSKVVVSPSLKHMQHGL
jgi:beta-glucosidase-like glycosyl hydrolase